MLVGFTRKVSKQVQGTHFSETTLSTPTRDNLMIGYPLIDPSDVMLVWLKTKSTGDKHI